MTVLGLMPGSRRCYLLTCKSIADVDKDWDGIAAARSVIMSCFVTEDLMKASFMLRLSTFLWISGLDWYQCLTAFWLIPK